MQLQLDLPPAWTLVSAGGVQHGTLTTAAGTEATLEVGPLGLRPDDLGRVLARAAGAALPPAMRLELGAGTALHTRDGWPLRVQQADVVTADGHVVERRLVAGFAFMEHAAIATVRLHVPTQFARLVESALAILRTGRPAWQQHASLAEQWDLEAAPAVLPRHDREREHARAQTMLAAARARITADPTAEAAHREAGIAYGLLGAHADAAVALRMAVALEPDRIDARYNLGLALSRLGDHAAALHEFRAVMTATPADFLVYRKVVQALYALERYDEGAAARVTLRELWRTSLDPRARLIREYVFDQFLAAGVWVHATETLQAADPGSHVELAFRAVDAAERPLGIALQVETSDAARAAGTPVVLAVVDGALYRVLATAATIPRYCDLKARAIDVVTSACEDRLRGSYSSGTA